MHFYNLRVLLLFWKKVLYLLDYCLSLQHGNTPYRRYKEKDEIQEFH